MDRRYGVLSLMPGDEQSLTNIRIEMKLFKLSLIEKPWREKGYAFYGFLECTFKHYSATM